MDKTKLKELLSTHDADDHDLIEKIYREVYDYAYEEGYDKGFDEGKDYQYYKERYD